MSDGFTIAIESKLEQNEFMGGEASVVDGRF
jgi:hypothetical protein